MKEQIETILIDNQLTPSEKVFLIWLAMNDGKTTLNNAKLGQQIGMSHQTAQRAILGLYQKGYITKVVKCMMYRGSGHLTKQRTLEICVKL